MIRSLPKAIQMKTPIPAKKTTAKVSVHHDLSIELHGENFSIRRELTIDEALGLVGMLTYVIREQSYKCSAQFVGVAS